MMLMVAIVAFQRSYTGMIARLSDTGSATRLQMILQHHFLRHLVSAFPCALRTRLGPIPTNPQTRFDKIPTASTSFESAAGHAYRYYRCSTYRTLFAPSGTAPLKIDLMVARLSGKNHGSSMYSGVRFSCTCRTEAGNPPFRSKASHFHLTTTEPVYGRFMSTQA
jgi:hypothetical protein